MNKARRIRIQKQVIRLESILDYKTELEDIRDELEDTNMEEEMARDNTPESLQESDRYIESEEISDKIDSAIEFIENALTNIEDAADTLVEI